MHDIVYVYIFFVKMHKNMGPNAKVKKKMHGGKDSQGLVLLNTLTWEKRCAISLRGEVILPRLAENRRGPPFEYLNKGLLKICETRRALGIIS
jgi:hypothetical protein